MRRSTDPSIEPADDGTRLLHCSRPSRAPEGSQMRPQHHRHHAPPSSYPHHPLRDLSSLFLLLGRRFGALGLRLQMLLLRLHYLLRYI